MFRNSKESRREKDGIVYFVRPDIEANGKTYERLAVQTHFVERGEDYIELIKKYVLPIYEEGDVLSIGEKIMSMCQNNTVEKKNIFSSWAFGQNFFPNLPCTHPTASAWTSHISSSSP